MEPITLTIGKPGESDVVLAELQGAARQLGMPLDEVVRRSTSNPAKIMGYEGTIGTLKPGANADISVFELRDGAFELRDSDGDTVTARRRLFVQSPLGPPMEPSTSPVAACAASRICSAARRRTGMRASHLFCGSLAAAAAVSGPWEARR